MHFLCVDYKHYYILFKVFVYSIFECIVAGFWVSIYINDTPRAFGRAIWLPTLPARRSISPAKEKLTDHMRMLRKNFHALPYVFRLFLRTVLFLPYNIPCLVFHSLLCFYSICLAVVVPYFLDLHLFRI